MNIKITHKVMGFFISLLFLSLFITGGCSNKTEKTSNKSVDSSKEEGAATAQPVDNKGEFTEEKKSALTNSATKVYGHPNWENYELNTGVFSLAFEGDLLWVATEIGLITYDLKKDEIVNRYDNKSGLLSNITTVVTIDKYGNKWVGTHGGGISKFNGKEWEKINVPKLADPFVYDIIFDSHNTVWVATWKGVSFCEEGKEWRSYIPKDGLIDEWVYAITIDNNDVKWFGTEGGITMFDGKNWKSYTHELDGLGASLDIIGKVEAIDNPSKHHNTAPGKEADGYNPNYVLAAATDSNNIKWFGTWGAGINRFDGKEFKNFTEKDGLPGNFVTDIYIDKKDKIWAATDKGIGIYDGDKWLTLTEPDGLLNDSVYDIAVDPKGETWYGTMTGISHLKGFLEKLNNMNANHPPL